MNAFEKIVHALMTEMETPSMYGWFHLLMFGLVVLITVLFVIGFKDCSDRIFRRIILICWIILAVTEIYVVLAFSFNYDGTVVTWDYAWYMFPFQFCSTPIYVLPFIAFMRESKFRDGFIAFTASFSLFGGLAVMFYPGDVFIEIIGINIQTMIHHGLQVVLGVFCAVHERRKLSFLHQLKSVPVFAGLVAVAFVLNETVYRIFASLGMDDTFNMFFISRHFDCTLPVLSVFYPILPYPLFLCLYIFGFALVAYIVYYLQKIVIGAVERKLGKV